MKCLVTGGAGFIGRWVVKELLGRGDRVVVYDDFSNSTPRNLLEFDADPGLNVVRGSVVDGRLLGGVWSSHGPFDAVYHLAASIRVQDSIDHPRSTFDADVKGTFEVLECCRRQYFEQNGLPLDKSFHMTETGPLLDHRAPRLVFMSTCMVYAPGSNGSAICESHPVRPSSPYAASKLCGEALALSYFHAYGLPVKVLRPFNTYGPFQKRNLEGGVVPIFIARDLARQALLVKGDGGQTRDLLYVEDCARFVVEAGRSAKGDGEVINAGLGRDIAIRDLARMVVEPGQGGNGSPVEHVAHDHPQAEIAKLLADCRKAEAIFDWHPKTDLPTGIQSTRAWMMENPGVL